jgi:sodium/potassium-transporting ATPase subunit alpha
MSDGRQIQNLGPEEVYSFLGSRREGLHEAEVAERLLEVGRNTVEYRDRWKHLRRLGRQFTNFFALLLFISAALCFVADRLQPGESMNVLGWALASVALLNALFSFLQEYRAERAMEALQAFLPQQVRVRRGGGYKQILAEDLVPGDLFLVSEGDRIAADARLVLCEGLLANNAPLTGEAKPLSLTAEKSQGRLTESANMLFAGCAILRGSGEAVIIATGLRSEFGKLAHLSQAMRRTPSPLERETAKMVRILTLIAVVMGVAFFLYGIFSGRSLWVNLVFMMGIIVANVPEGLLPTFTLALAMGSLRMARKNVLVKGLSAVEALGAVHVICTDKTGTLTLNRLTITRTADPCCGADLDEAGAGRLLGLALGASEVRTVEGGFSGDPLDVAVSLACADRLPGVLPAGEKYFAFDVEKRRSAGICSLEGERFFTVKGAWEALHPMLAGIDPGMAGSVVPVSPETLNEAETALHGLAARGLRVIAVACRKLLPEEGEGNQEEMERDLLLAGFLGIEDPVRPEVPAAVAKCHRAGIEVLMVTGDHPDTALAVARNSGIVEDASARVLTGDLLEKLTEEELASACTDGVRVFARTTPEQKMKIISALKTLDKVVAMTGDGVNDAPALKAADVGIAMGRGGTDVARAAAQIILLDDNFASIVAGVEEGRTVFSNIRKFTNYVLVSNGPEIVPYLLYILLPVPLALTIIQILSIDLGTDIVPSMALGQEPPSPEEMERPPRDRSRGLLTLPLIVHSYLFLGLLEALWSMFLFFLVLTQGGWHYGEDLAAADPLYRSATGIALATILLMQIGNLLGRRYRLHSGLDRGIFKNGLMLAGIAIQVVFSWALLYWGPLQKVLQTGAVEVKIYLLAWLGIPLIFGIDYLRKRVVLRRGREKGENRIQKTENRIQKTEYRGEKGEGRRESSQAPGGA